jgi:nitroreductase
VTSPDRRLHELLGRRSSPRSFDPAHRLGIDVEDRLLEAVRWSPSAGNSQPWRVLLTRRGTPEHERLLATLSPRNAAWAKDASALLLLAARTSAPDGSALTWASYDTGQAAAHLTTQAQADGLVVHQMGGFDPDAVRSTFDLPAAVQPLVVIAIGRQARADRLPEPLAARETAPRTRLPLEEIVLSAEPAVDVRRSA